MKFKVDQTTQKLRGGYYTPQNLADFVSKWVLEKQPKSVLEPSCGDGVFIQALHNNKCDKNIELSCFELLDTEVQKASNLCTELGFKNASVTSGDFLVWANDQLDKKIELFDAVIGNPPFIRYQFLEKSFQEQAELVFKKLDQKFTKHTNAWVPFLLSTLALLNKGGRMAMVIPSEIINVMHAQSLRSYMGEICSKILIIDPKEIWFENTLQGAVIIMAEKKTDISIPSEGVGILSVEGSEFLEKSPEVLFNETLGINGETVEGKWTKAVLNKSEISLINKIISHESVHKFKTIATVDVGIVTGANKFFLVDNETVETYNLSAYAHPMFGKSQHCPGILYDENQHKSNQLNNLPTNFLYIESDYNELPLSVQNYIQLGEQEKLNERYKCRIRKPWYKVPSIYSTEIGMLKRCHEAPRLILNSVGAYTTDTAYRITSSFTNAENLVCSFLNPLTAITAELEGRYYGGGVLELVPSEIEKLYIPVIDDYKHDPDTLNQLVKDGKVEEVIRNQGEAIFTKLGFSKQDNEELMKIWQKLRDRRMRK
ncbi:MULTISPECIES: N-6 DNA methylase [Acinetobacter]|jgi:adenine-specific DNA-methyltransferase|uniref:site-specific DNA-methyltransferase (adenine-specific) n=4 Tax=Acinetobacter TaxID=469 RepID=A0A1S6KKN1_ACIBA|nr:MULTISPECIES: N-6 DNA methylase [Acinetobacter]NWK64336.1 N-6 DNA methylase [Acinetobacter sp. SwsAc3]AQT19049.1 restriction modification methyltransferase [Acinetobacter baumannii]AUT32428.1 N-6 DNA methylase [Acinetobacter pittii]AVN16606.1 N-6 DNA methylase [Acinetobacter pittii]KKD17600.1 modification methylase [Acinetobacter baumannii]